MVANIRWRVSVAGETETKTGGIQTKTEETQTKTEKTETEKLKWLPICGVAGEKETQTGENTNKNRGKKTGEIEMEANIRWRGSVAGETAKMENIAAVVISETCSYITTNEILLEIV